MRGMRWKYGKVYRPINTERDHIGCDMASMAVHDQQSSSARVIEQRSRLKDGGQPFVCMAIAGPTTLASRETPFWGRAGRYPCCVGILGFEDEQGRDSRARCTRALNGCYPLLAGPYNLPTGFLPDIDERFRRLALLV